MSQNRDLEVLQQLVYLIPTTIDILHTIHYIFENKKFIQLRSIKAVRRLEIGQEDIYLKAKELISLSIELKESKLRQEFVEFLSSLKFVYKDKDVLHYIQNLDDGQKSIPKLEFKLGQVTIIQFWANWCGQSTQVMQRLKLLLTQCIQWEDKVQFIGISLDDEVDHWKQRLEEEKLKDFGQHYRFSNGWNDDEPAVMSLNFKAIPFIVILDKFNRISYRGHPLDIDVFEEVDKLTQIIEDNHKEDVSEVLQKSNMEMGDQAFQELRILFEEQLVEEMQHYDLSGGEFRVEMIEKNKITHDGEIKSTPFSRTLMKVAYEINIELKESKSEVVKILTNSVPERYLQFIKTVIKDSKQDLNIALKSMFMEQSIDIIYKQTRITQYHYHAVSDKFQIHEEVDHGAEINNKKEKQHIISQYYQAMAKIEPILKNLHNLDLEEYASKLLYGIKKDFQLCVGDIFQKIENFQDSFKRPAQKIIGNKLHVLIVIYWSVDDYECRQGIKRAVDLLKFHKWNEIVKQVKIMALCIDEVNNFQECLDYFNSEVVQNVEFYFRGQGKLLTEIYTDFDRPYYIVVDQSNLIRVIGHEVNVEQAVTDALHKKPLLNRKSTIEQQRINTNQSQALEQYLQSNQYKDILNKLGDEYQFSLVITLKEEIKENQASVCYFPEIEYMIRENKLPMLKPILNSFTSIIQKQQLIIKEHLLKTFDVPFPGSACEYCNKHLDKDMQQYYQPFDKYFLCCECAEYDDTSKVGMARYKCSDTLIFINAPLTDYSVLKEIDQHKIGKNLKIPINEPGSQHHDMCCNGCGEDNKGPRYIALSCCPGTMREEGYCDLCCDCFEIVKDKESEAAKDLRESFSQEIQAQDEEVGDEQIVGHSILNRDCLFARILFSNGYYDF